MIFSGTVASVRRHPASHDLAIHDPANHGPAQRNPAIETVLITFHIEHAVRGATPGQDLTISQWVALWAAGQRYRVGERVLLFLYPPSKLGLTSRVAGPLGRFVIDAFDRVTPSEQQLSLLQTEPLLSGKSRLDFNDLAGAVRARAQARPQPSAKQ